MEFSEEEAFIDLWSPETDVDSGSWWLPKFNGDFVIQSYICGKIFMNIQSVRLQIRAKFWKNAPYRNVEKFCREFLDPDPEADDFQKFCPELHL